MVYGKYVTLENKYVFFHINKHYMMIDDMTSLSKLSNIFNIYNDINDDLNKYE